MARKGDLKATRHLHLGLDDDTSQQLLESALRDDRTLTQQARWYIRRGIKADAAPVEDKAGVVE